MSITPKTYEEIVYSALMRAGINPKGMTFSNPQQDVEVLAKEFVHEVILEIYDYCKTWDFALTKTTYTWPAGTNEVALSTIDDTLEGIDINNIQAIFLSASYHYKQLKPCSYEDYKRFYQQGEITITQTGTIQNYTVFDNKLIIWPAGTDTLTIHYQPNPSLPVEADDVITALPAKYHAVIIDGTAARIAEQLGDPSFGTKQQFFELQVSKMKRVNRDFGKRKRVLGSDLFIR